MTLVKHQIQFNSSCNLDLVKLWSKSGYCVATYNLTLNKLVKIWIMSRSSQSLDVIHTQCYAVNQKDDTVELLREFIPQ